MRSFISYAIAAADHITRSFRAKMILLVLMSVVVTSVVIGLWTMQTTTVFLTGIQSEEFVSILGDARKQIDYYFKDRKFDLRKLFDSNGFTGPLERYYSSRSQSGGEYQLNEISKFFAIVKNKMPVFEAMVVLDDRGDAVMASLPLRKLNLEALRRMRKEVKDKVCVSDVYYDEKRRKMLQWAMVPIEMQSGKRAVVCTRMNTDDLSLMLSQIKLSANGDVYVLDNSGTFITQPRNVPSDPATGEQLNMLGQKAMRNPKWPDKKALPKIEKYLKKMPVESSPNDHRNVEFYGSKMYLPDQDWWLVCEKERSQIVGPVARIRKELIVADILICAFFLFLAIRTSKSLLRPAAALSEAAKRINDGMVAVQIEGGGEDEIGQMITAFNDLAKRISVTETKLNASNKTLNRQHEQLVTLNERLEELSVTDGLTGLYNHRHFWQILNDELSRVNRYKGELALVLLDIDNFKAVNDEFGHAVGDLLLQSIAKIIRETVRETDIVARYGGEEFTVLLPDTSREGVLNVSEKVRAAVEGMIFRVPDTDITVSVTVSIGVSVFIDNRRDFFNAADKALYQSKKQGKNQVMFAVTG
jgi:diguanylate cyclase (GGDEF)-like protein